MNCNTSTRTMTVQEVANAAGDRNATMQSAGQYPVMVRTATGKMRNVVGARFGSSLNLSTSDSGNALSVSEIVYRAGGNSSVSLTSHGNASVTVTTRTGKTRRVVDAVFNGRGIVLVTAKQG